VDRAPGQPEELIRQVSNPVPDLAKIAGPGQYREHHHRQYRADPEPDPPDLAWIGDPVKHRDQPRHLGDPEIRYLIGSTIKDKI
jgi:hypothetical protein